MEEVSDTSRSTSGSRGLAQPITGCFRSSCGERISTACDSSGRLIDVVGEDDSHPLSSLMEVIGVLIEKYEDENVPELMDV